MMEGKTCSLRVIDTRWEKLLFDRFHLHPPLRVLEKNSNEEESCFPVQHFSVPPGVSFFFLRMSIYILSAQGQRFLSHRLRHNSGCTIIMRIMKGEGFIDREVFELSVSRDFSSP